MPFKWLALALCVTACGDLSNQDIAFLEAIPRKESLHVQVPDQGAQPLCGPGSFGDAEVWNNARRTGDALNAGVDGILGLVDKIRALPPTTRDEDSRVWGPFPDQQHPGVTIRVTLSRELDAHSIPWRYLYSIDARRAGAFLPLLAGEFYGAQASKGSGKLTIHFENALALQTNKPDDPASPERIFYDLASEPRTVSLDLTDISAARLLKFDYGYVGYLDGHGRFDYAFPDKNGCVITVSTSFTARGAGRGRLHFSCGGGVFVGDVVQCWNENACLTRIEDPYAFTPACGGLKPCLLGAASSCAVP